MQKNWLTKLLVALILIALAGVFVAAFWLVRHPASQDTQTTPKVFTHPVLVVDFSNNKILSEEELKQGSDAILAVRAPHTHNQDELFNSVAALLRLDVNKDNQIDVEHDPIFPYLELIFFTDDGKNRKYVSLKTAGIKTIIINKQRLLLPAESVVNNLVGEAVMNDGNTRAIRLINVSVGK